MPRYEGNYSKQPPMPAFFPDGLMGSSAEADSKRFLYLNFTKTPFKLDFYTKVLDPLFAQDLEKHSGDYQGVSWVDVRTTLISLGNLGEDTHSFSPSPEQTTIQYEGEVEGSGVVVPAETVVGLLTNALATYEPRQIEELRRSHLLASVEPMQSTVIALQALLRNLERLSKNKPKVELILSTEGEQNTMNVFGINLVGEQK